MILSNTIALLYYTTKRKKCQEKEYHLPKYFLTEKILT